MLHKVQHTYVSTCAYVCVCVVVAFEAYTGGTSARQASDTRRG